MKDRSDRVIEVNGVAERFREADVVVALLGATEAQLVVSKKSCFGGGATRVFSAAPVRSPLAST